MPEDWHDITLKQAAESIGVAKTMPEKLQELTYGDKETETTTTDLLEFAEFYKRWAAYWTKVPVDTIGQMATESTGVNLGLLDMYKIYLSKFLSTPAKYTPLDRFEFKGKWYGLASTVQDIKAKPMLEGSFDEFIDNTMVKQAYDEAKGYDYTRLPMLTAMLFRPIKKKGKKEYIEPYDADTVENRESLFMGLTMDKAWSAYFFLQTWSNTFPKLMQTLYLKKEKEKTLQ